jgi:predicted  nucleic acid-binding Zn-ribbon protein
MPVFDKWSKGEVTIALTGQHGFDRTEAIKAWTANGGGSFKGYVFHHDGLVLSKITFKGTELPVGRMQLVPEQLNKLAHVGSASQAKGMIVDEARARDLVREVNELSIRNQGPLRKIAGRFMSKLPKVAKRIVRTAIPVIGGLLVIIDFSENAEAHGVGGAIIRGVPLLGDVVNVYDVASDLATAIEEEADESVRGNQERANQATREATKAAATLTVEEFDKLSKQIRITNPYFEAGSLQEPLEALYNDMHTLILLQREGKNIAYPDDATSEQKQTESAFNMKLRMARERFEREVRQRIERPGPRPQRPSA